MISLRVSAPPERVFDWFADPVNRPRWQSSLRSVEVLTEGPPRLGTRWRDRTAVGIAPLMETTVHDRPHRWSEVGTWRGISAVLDMTFTPVDGGTDVDARFALQARGLWAVPARVAAVLAPLAVRSDLRRAARLIEHDLPPHRPAH